MPAWHMPEVLEVPVRFPVRVPDVVSVGVPDGVADGVAGEAPAGEGPAPHARSACSGWPPSPPRMRSRPNSTIFLA
ncbi:hypothetical protein GCM10023220_64470 [Streptomyces ziwulingensis]|uniref:Uncharacterized protein n=1 Tax=Streptomyces ziwulingensis TaxID=1045501 RepID=A0ABP9CYQ9_9ACTN